MFWIILRFNSPALKQFHIYLSQGNQWRCQLDKLSKLFLKRLEPYGRTSNEAILKLLFKYAIRRALLAKKSSIRYQLCCKIAQYFSCFETANHCDKALHPHFLHFGDTITSSVQTLKVFGKFQYWFYLAFHFQSQLQLH